MENKTCGECRGFSESESRCLFVWGQRKVYADDEACRKFSEKKPIPPPTLFHRITVNEETLAEEFVGVMFDHRYTGRYRFYSMLTGDWYETHEEAIAATVNKLKEVSK